ncbi:MAG: ribonuclease domain-containing protein [Marmoricola sp.]
MNQRSGLAGGLVVVLVVLAALFAWHGGSSSHAPQHGPRAGSTTGRATGSHEVTLSGLPAEAQHTVALIERGGPYPYDRDGVTFRNLEGHLPPQPDGYYREYTVPTPGSADRGARRIVLGAGGELYYSSDHYKTFRVIVGAHR